MRHSRILSVGSYVPPRVWRNEDLCSLMDTSDEWITQRTGIKQRHWVEFDSSLCTSDLAKEACDKALENAKVDKSEIGMLILCTLSPDHEFPGTACFLQAKMGLHGIPALDVRQQCSGFIYGLSIADQFIRTGMHDKILLVGAETHSKGLDKTTEGRDVAVLFGDGAGAVVLGAANGPKDKNTPHILSTHLHADGRFARDLWVEEPTLAKAGDRYPKGGQYHLTKQYPQMNGKVVFSHASRRLPEALMEALAANQLKLADVDLFVLHQANLRINEMVAKMMEIPEEKVFNTIDRFGNTTAATIPLGLDAAVKAGKLKPGMLVASAAFGSGFTWGSALIRW